MKKAKSKKTRIILSIMALAEVLVLIAGVTFSWMEGGNSGYVKGSDIVISSGSSLTMIKDGKTTTSIVIPDCTLEETSSSDGRNFFFPMADTTSSTTSEMTFREGTPTDRNTKYVSLDFQLVAGDSPTDVYLGAGTIIQCDNQELSNALRMSFSLNNGETPIVFKPTQMPGVTEGISYSPITAINTETGLVTTQTSTRTKAYGDYYYSGDAGTPLFSLDQGETLNITLSIWLEGTEFSGDDIANKNLSIYIDFTTMVDDLVKYNFVDNTHGYSDALAEYWVSNIDELNGSSYDTMMYVFDNIAQRYYAMEKVVNETDTTGAKWEIYIPKSITDFSFRRYSIDIDHWWNEWEPSMTDIKTDPNNEHTFVAICGNPNKNSGTEIEDCYGYWKDEYGTFRVYFQMECAWNDLHCYAWNSDGYCASTGEWPGKSMDYVKTLDGNKPIYYIDLKESENVVGIQFNNGKEKTIVYFEKDYGYDANYAYLYGDAGELLGEWSGTKAEWDEGLGMNRVYITGTPNKSFNIIHNVGSNSKQVTANNTGVIGKSYIFREDDDYNNNNNDYLEEITLEYNIKDSEYFFNGMLFYYKNSSNKGFSVYTDSEKSLIHP